MKTVFLLALLLLSSYSQIYYGQLDSPVIPDLCAEDDSGEYAVFGGFCWEVDQLAQCQNMMTELNGQELQPDHQFSNLAELLEDIEPKKGNIYSNCDVRVSEGKEIYEFLLALDDEYAHDLSCVNHRVYFVGQDGLLDGQEINLPVQQSEFYDQELQGQVYYDEFFKTFQFNVNHSDLVNQYGCSYYAESEEGVDYYRWNCVMKLEIRIGNEKQLTYEFSMLSQIDRKAEAELDVSIQQNLITGECCKQDLEIQTGLYFCNDENCLEYDLVSDGPIFRQETFYMVHIIEHDNFNDYELDFVELNFGPFKMVPKSVRKASIVGKGAVILEVQSSIAFTQLEAKVISQLVDPNLDGVRRRVLADLSNEDDYLSAKTIVEVSAQTESSEDESASQNSMILSFGLSMILVLALF